MVDIIHRISIKAPLPKVYAALSTVEDVAGWWTKETSGVSKPGGAVQVVFRSAAGDELGKMELEVASRRRTTSRSTTGTSVHEREDPTPSNAIFAVPSR